MAAGTGQLAGQRATHTAARAGNYGNSVVKLWQHYLAPLLGLSWLIACPTVGFFI
jgi:hypothetical protein